jgi:2-polyprenyl-3-methyl-5-hydroxy-6-metoxy-1,4-benzoquinol methylase
MSLSGDPARTRSSDAAQQAAWDELADWMHTNVVVPGDAVHYGPDVADERELRLLGDVAGKRILDLGAGDGRNAVALARSGARVTALDPSARNLALGRALAEDADVRVEWRQGDVSELSFLPPASVDLVLSTGALAHVDDLGRVFRAVHRVLRTEAPFVIAVPHPALRLVPGSARHGERYNDTAPVPVTIGPVVVEEFPHTISTLFTQLHRAGFRVDVLLEPDAPARGPRSVLWEDAYRVAPVALVMRARKQGV